jgi:hypothetical protein
MHRRLWNRNELYGVFVLLAFAWQLIIGRSRLAAGYWLLASGFWPLAAGSWLLAPCYFLLVRSYSIVLMKLFSFLPKKA